jgi:phosphomevalonate kinase
MKNATKLELKREIDQLQDQLLSYRLRLVESRQLHAETRERLRFWMEEYNRLAGVADLEDTL